MLKSMLTKNFLYVFDSKHLKSVATKNIQAGLFGQKSIGWKLIFDLLPHYLQMRQSVKKQIVEFFGNNLVPNFFNKI